VEAIAAIEAGATPTAQDSARATHAAMLDKRDGAIDFARPAAEVAARIRGVDPWPGAFATLRRPGRLPETVKLFRARALALSKPRDASPPAGTVLAIDASGMLVACADTHAAAAVRDVQAAGRKRLTASH